MGLNGMGIEEREWEDKEPVLFNANPIELKASRKTRNRHFSLYSLTFILPVILCLI